MANESDDHLPEHLKDLPAIATFTPKQLAERWSMSTITLAKWRWQGSGPRFTKMGDGPSGRIKYPRSSVLIYEKTHNMRSTTAE